MRVRCSVARFQRYASFATILATCSGLLLSCAGTAAAPPARVLPPPTQLHALAASELTEAERKYGRAPQRDASVTYARDVIIVEGGPSIIRGLSPDGLVWTIDPNAPHARELEEGKVAFVTGRCVGRVLSATRDDQGLHLIL